ncbi:hypothetical protein [Alkaliphilus serpentinus]|uniref:FMN-binding domain-containing protein n=1 Tax=Alkaliphilus serpentinus TaxID=1482731 RepID=A0A833HQ25_9FIRM|nr:hypothetical protein [Alkaliphilus serpentinus]KAB3531469.1 hypothetical protein F8153_04630 [Alkaliphilus serpentinus]
MKRVLMILLTIVLAFAMLAGCSKDTATETPEPAPAETPAEGEEEADAEEETVETVKLGLGVVNSIKRSKEYSNQDDKETLALGQVDTVMAAVVFDQDGKVVSVKIDNAQTKVNFDKDMKVTSDKAADIKTKAEKKDEYGMRKASGIQKEWFEQIEALETWMVGKTVEEIKAMKVKEVDENHKHVPDVPELTSSVTITIESYVEAVEKAYSNTIEVEGFDKLGLGHNVSIAKSKDYSVDANGKETLPVAQVDTVMAATAFDKDGKVVGTLIDNAQIKVNFDAEGKLTSDKTAELKTKAEKKDEYGMKKASGIQKEWYEQMNELQNWMIGKTVDEIKAMKVKEVDERHKHVPDVPELTSLVTITIESYIAAVEEAYNTAR